MILPTLVALVLALWLLVRAPVPSMKSAMVIVEPRRHPQLKHVVENFDRNMPKHYDLYIFHGASAGEYAARAAEAVAGRVLHFVRLPTDNFTVNDYNAFLKSPEFWNRVDAENVLVFQTDAALCGASSRKIADFEHLGYVGCNFGDKMGRNTYWGPHPFYGVGGLSFRKKSVALKCLKNAATVAPDFPEDVFYSRCVENDTFGKQPRSAQEVSEFCSQGSFSADSFGGHRVEWMNKQMLPRFLDYCPEARPLLPTASPTPV